jgi:hypothetical protein
MAGLSDTESENRGVVVSTMITGIAARISPMA